MTGLSLDAMYERLIPLVIKENHKVADELGVQLHNYGSLYRDSEVPFGDDGRVLHSRVLKIPTFTEGNTPRYYGMVLGDIDFWRKGEMRRLHAQVVEGIDNRDVDAYTIFMLGRFHGYFDPVTSENTRRCNLFILHGSELTRKYASLVMGTVTKYLESRCQGMERRLAVKDVKAYGRVRTDIERMRRFNETLDLLFVPQRKVCTVVR